MSRRIVTHNIRDLAPSASPTIDVWPEAKMPGRGAKEAEVPRKDGFHRITNVSRPTLALFSALRSLSLVIATMVGAGSLRA